MKFKKLTRKRIKELLPFFAAQKLRLSNFSAGYLFMWNKYISPEYTVPSAAVQVSPAGTKR